MKSQRNYQLKTPTNFLKWVLISVIAILLLSAGCEKSDPITGDSYLKVINKCDVSITIYFDGSKLGKINADKNETWSVPSGTHTIKATSSFYKDYEASYKFYSGQTTTIRLELSSNGKSELIDKD